MSKLFSTAHEEVATRRTRRADFRLAAVLIRLFMCLQRGGNSLTCDLSDFKSVCTWGTPDKTVVQPSIPAKADLASIQPAPNMICPNRVLALSGSFRTEFPFSKTRNILFLPDSDGEQRMPPRTAGTVVRQLSELRTVRAGPRKSPAIHKPESRPCVVHWSQKSSAAPALDPPIKPAMVGCRGGSRTRRNA